MRSARSSIRSSSRLIPRQHAQEPAATAGSTARADRDTLPDAGVTGRWYLMGPDCSYCRKGGHPAENIFQE